MGVTNARPGAAPVRSLPETLAMIRSILFASLIALTSPALAEVPSRFRPSRLRRPMNVSSCSTAAAISATWAATARPTGGG
jgi:hypothetical protein